MAQCAVEEAANYTTERKQFGQCLANFEAIQAMIANMSAKIESLRCMLYSTGRMIDNNLDTTKESAMIKLLASDTAMEIVTDALQLFGGYGYMKEYPLEKIFRDVKATQILGGNNRIQQLVIAKDILTEYAKGEYNWCIA